MSEQVQVRPAPFGAGPAGLDFADAAVGGAVTVSHGVHHESLPVGNMTVGEIRRRYADRFDIDPGSTAELDGRTAGDETVVRPGQMLAFARRAGEKGVA
jgi:hypothetical protein